MRRKLKSHTFDCPSCHEHSYRVIIERTESHPELVQCLTCGAELFWPLPSLAELTEFYGRSNFLSNKGRIGAENYLKDRAPLRNSVASFAKHLAASGVPQGAVIVDLGCNYGANTIELRQIGFDAWGVDLSGEGIDWLNAHGGRGYLGSILDNDFPLKQIEVLYSSHTLDYLLDPYAVLRRGFELMSDQGYMSLVLPHWGGLLAQRQRERWKWFQFPTHLHYFRAEYFPAIVQKIGFQSVAVSTTYDETEATETLKAFEAPVSSITESSVRAVQAILAQGRLGQAMFINAHKTARS